MCLNAEAAEGPQLSLGAKSMRCLQDTEQHGRSNWTDRGNLTERFPGLVFLAFRQQLAANLLAQGSQGIQLLEVELCSPMHTRFSDLPEPFGAMARCIDLFAGTGDAPAAVQCLHPRHDPSDIFGDREI